MQCPCLKCKSEGLPQQPVPYPNQLGGPAVKPLPTLRDEWAIVIARTGLVPMFQGREESFFTGCYRLADMAMKARGKG